MYDVPVTFFLRSNGQIASTAATASTSSDAVLSHMADQYDEHFDDSEVDGADNSEVNVPSDQVAQKSGECPCACLVPVQCCLSYEFNPMFIFPIAAVPRPTPLLCAPLIRHSRAFVDSNGHSPFIAQLESKPLVMPFGLNTPRDRPSRELLQTLPG
jgi:hypothetical protein